MYNRKRVFSPENESFKILPLFYTEVVFGNFSLETDTETSVRLGIYSRTSDIAL